MDKSAIDTPSREIDLRNIPVHLRTALRRTLEFEARAPAPRSAEEAEQCEEQLRAIADEFFGALLTPVLQRAVRSAAVGDAASALVRHLPRRMRSDGLETVNVRTSRGTTVPVTTPYYREKHARRAKRRPGLYPALVVLGPSRPSGTRSTGTNTVGAVAVTPACPHVDQDADAISRPWSSTSMAVICRRVPITVRLPPPNRLANASLTKAHEPVRRPGGRPRRAPGRPRTGCTGRAGDPPRRSACRWP